jgi:uncharacterized protein YndB with AHSA1/START domain
MSMAPVVASAEIARPPEEVFAYVTDPSRLCEWQWGVVSGRMEGGGPPAAGSRFTTTTRIGGAEQVSTLEITEFSPPQRWAARGVDGPVRVIVQVTVDPLGDGTQSRVTLALDFEGHGPGRMLVPLVVRPQAAREAPQACDRLRERLERGG